MSLLDPPVYDEARVKRRRRYIALAVFALLLVLFAAWELRFWPEERAADRFFAALEANDMERAYGLWLADPGWKSHPEKHAKYPFNDFQHDWGPAGEYGAIRSHKLSDAYSPAGGMSASGVIIEVQINGKGPPARLWVEKSDKSISFPPPF
jgi:hypothetical protein